MDLVRANAVNLLELKPDAVIATGGRVIPILMQLTRSIPIILPGVSDPVATGVAQSLARPGGNVTGFTSFEHAIFGKWLEMLKQIAPATARVATIFNPDNPNTALYRRLFEADARALAVQAIIAPSHGIADIDRVLETLSQQPNGAVLFAPDLTTTQLRDQLIPIVARHRLPAIYADEWRPDLLCRRSHRDIPSHRIIRRSRSTRREARRSAVSAADEIRAHHQSQDRQGARRRDSADAARPGRRGDRMRRRALRLPLS